MDTKVERVAEALHEYEWSRGRESVGWHIASYRTKERYRELAKVAIEAVEMEDA